MKKVKITQVKSVIDRSERQKKTMVALGLRKMNASVEKEATPQVLGMIDKVNHLVKVEELANNIPKKFLHGKFQIPNDSYLGILDIFHIWNLLDNARGENPVSKNQLYYEITYTKACRRQYAQ
jgi:large subunit ribosomal protein L30